MANLKRVIVLLLTILTILTVFSACSSPKKEAETTTESGDVLAPTYESDLMYYDRYGNAYDDLSKLKFYDKNKNEYTYVEMLENPYFIDSNGNKLDGDKSFVDRNGYFIYDEKGEITLGSEFLEGKDKNGVSYYPAATVRWTNDGSLVTAFGMGEEIKPEE